MIRYVSSASLVWYRGRQEEGICHWPTSTTVATRGGKPWGFYSKVQYLPCIFRGYTTQFLHSDNSYLLGNPSLVLSIWRRSTKETIFYLYIFKKKPQNSRISSSFFAVADPLENPYSGIFKDVYVAPLVSNPLEDLLHPRSVGALTTSPIIHRRPQNARFVNAFGDPVRSGVFLGQNHLFVLIYTLWMW